MPPGAGRQLDGRKEMGEDASWSLELVETAGRADRDGRRCLLEPRAGRDSWTGGKRWEEMPPGAGRHMPAGAGRQLDVREEMGDDGCWSW